MSTATGGRPGRDGLERQRQCLGEEAAMPRDDSGGFHDLHGCPPAAPDLGEQHPEDSVGPTEPKPSRRGLLEDGELVAEGEDLCLEFDSSSEAGSKWPARKAVMRERMIG